MLRPACLWFLRRAQPGVETRHRSRCQSCDAYVSAIEAADRAEISLPTGLQRRLRSIPRATPSFPQRSLPLPGALKDRLSEILPPAPPALPRFAGSPLYAVVASQLVVIAVAALWGNPYEIVRPAFHNVQSSATAALAHTSDKLSEWVRDARSEIELQGDHAERLGNDLLRRLEETLTLPIENGDPDADS